MLENKKTDAAFCNWSICQPHGYYLECSYSGSQTPNEGRMGQTFRQTPPPSPKKRFSTKTSCKCCKTFDSAPQNPQYMYCTIPTLLHKPSLFLGIRIGTHSMHVNQPPQPLSRVTVRKEGEACIHLFGAMHTLVTCLQRVWLMLLVPDMSKPRRDSTIVGQCPETIWPGIYEKRPSGLPMIWGKITISSLQCDFSQVTADAFKYTVTKS